MASLKLNHREFDRTLKEYRKISKKTWPEICDSKALFIAIGAQNATEKADWMAAKAELGAQLSPVIGKRGKALKRKILTLGDRYYNTLAVKIVVARLRRIGQAIPGADQLKQMALSMVRARAASVAFIKSGWGTAIRILKRRVRDRSAVSDSTARTVGQAKGNAIPAREGNATRTIISNMAQARKYGTHNKTALFKFGGPALQQAFDNETSSMKTYIENKMRGDAQEAGIKTN